jgi:hypothetical protein
MTFLYHIFDTIVQQVAHLQKKAGAHDQHIETLHPGPLSLHFLLGSSHLGTAHISVLRRHPYESPKAEQQPTLGEERKLFKMEKSMPASTFKAAKRNDVRMAAEFRPDLQPWHVQHCFIRADDNRTAARCTHEMRSTVGITAFSHRGPSAPLANMVD